MSQDNMPAKPRSRRRTRWLLIMLGGVLTFVLTIGLLLVFAPAVSDRLGNIVAGNIVPPDTQEAAITAFTPTASLGEFAALSGRGEGLDCSIDNFIEHTAFRNPIDGVSVNLRYRQACVAHDYCYRHGSVTYGYTQADCDASLARAALRVCRETADAADCLTQVRKVYAGLTVGGAGSFRPTRPDLLLGGETASTSKKLAEACHKATPGNAPPAQAFAYPGWSKALASRFGPGWFDSSLRRDYRLATARCYDQLSPVGVNTLLAAWMDMASTAGEYDPFPLGTASIAVPRILNLDGESDALVFYWQRASGARLSSFGWAPEGRPGVLVACKGPNSCIGAPPSGPLPQTFDFRPGPPWVGRIGVKQNTMAWWRRQLTGIDPTGGQIELIHEASDRAIAPAQWDQWTDLCASSVFPFERSPAAFSIVAIDPSDCEASNASHIPKVRHPLLRYRSVDARGAKLSWRWGRAYLPGLDHLSTWLTNPPDVERDNISLPNNDGKTLSGLRFTTFRRLPADFRQKLEARTWSMPADFKPRPNLPRALGPVSAIYAMPEASEPYATIRGNDQRLRLLTAQCVPGRRSSERCSHQQDGTIVTLWSPLGTPLVQPLRLSQSYAMMRAIVIKRADYAKFTGSGSYVLLLTRTTLNRQNEGYRLDGYLDAIDVSDTGLTNLGEVALGKLAFSTSLSNALLTASRLYPLADDIDNDGQPDVVIADPQSGITSLAFLNPLHTGVTKSAQPNN